MKNTIIGVICVGAVLGTLAFFNLTPFRTIVQSVFGGTTGTAGNTYGTEKIAAIVINLAGTGQNGTSTSITNTDATDRYVSSVKIGCEGFPATITDYNGAKASLQVSIGTTTSASPSAFLSTAAVAQNLTVPTTTNSTLVAAATTTPAAFGLASTSVAFIWPTGTSMTFFWNGTTTAKCTEGVAYFGS